MAFTLQPLPYSAAALAPHISQETMEFHHAKHNQAYIDNGNKLIAGTEFENMALEEIIRKTAGDPEKQGIFNNLAQVWNHIIYWHSMSPNGGKLNDKIEKQLITDFGSVENFKEQFATAGATQFGSGWAWLVLEAGQLKIVKTANAANPLASGAKVLLAMDVWEHSYYID